MLAKERQLADRAAKRDARAFAELYDQYVDAIYRYVYYRSGRTDVAEELTTQVFLQAREAIGRYQRKGIPFSSWLYRIWLYRIARNKAKDYIREHGEPSSPEYARAVMSSTDAFDEAEPGFDSHQVQTTLAQLTWDQQEIIILRFIEGYSWKEVAAVMEKRPEEIRFLQHRALEALQPHLERAGREGANAPGSKPVRTLELPDYRLDAARD